MEERQICDFCGTKLVDRSRFKNRKYWDFFQKTGKCQKCRMYDELLKRAEPWNTHKPIVKASPLKEIPEIESSSNHD